MDSRTYRLTNHSPKDDDTVSSYIGKLVIKVKSQIKALFFDQKDQILIIGFQATFKRTRDTNNFYECAAMWVRSNYVKALLAHALNNCICAEERSSPFAASLHRDDTPSGKLFQFYVEVVKNLWEKFPVDQTIAENDTAIPRDVQPSNVTPHQYVDDPVAKSSKTVDVFDENSLIDVFIEGVDVSIWNNQRSK